MKMRSLLTAGCCAALLTFSPAAAKTKQGSSTPAPVQAEGQYPHAAPAEGYPYLLFLPQGYDAATAAKWPVIIFLHGSGEAGTDTEKVKVHGPPKLVASDPNFPFIVISPQAPDRSGWQPAKLNATLDAALKGLRADNDRIYLTGLSMGGIGTWAWAEANASRFAAIAPVAARGDVAGACKLAQLPVWAFHGDNDPIVPTSGDIDMVAAIRACGGNPRLTIYPATGHDSWDATYTDPALYLWFLHQRRKAN